jgi:hypothetical protein
LAILIADRLGETMTRKGRFVSLVSDDNTDERLRPFSLSPSLVSMTILVSIINQRMSIVIWVSDRSSE